MKIVLESQKIHGQSHYNNMVDCFDRLKWWIKYEMNLQFAQCLCFILSNKEGVKVEYEVFRALSSKLRDFSNMIFSPSIFKDFLNFKTWNQNLSFTIIHVQVQHPCSPLFLSSFLAQHAKLFDIQYEDVGYLLESMHPRTSITKYSCASLPI